MEDRTLLSTFVVSNTGDSGPGSLRQAILDSNATTGASNTIDFAIAGSGVQTILPLTGLPAITNPVMIDGFSQPGYSGSPLIEINGSQAGGGDGLLITGADATVRGLDIDSFPQGAGIHMTGTGATGDWVYGCFLGTDPTGTQAEPNDEGVEIDAGAADNLIGTNGDGIDDAAERNVISGNLFAGIRIDGQGTDGNAIAGNFIGTSVTGDVALSNGSSYVYYGPEAYIGGGVVIQGGASSNRIGTDGSGVDDTGQRNIIAGNAADGIDMVGTGTDGNIVAGNFIGTDVSGTLFLINAGDGVFLADGASSNWVGAITNGSSASGDGNLITGNRYDGVQIGNDCSSNIVAGNKIGTDVSGTLALGNGQSGVEVDSGATDNTIGGTASGSSNIISANIGYGIWIKGQGADGNFVVGNAIGTDITGNKVLANGWGGGTVGAGTDGSGPTNNTVGGLTTSTGVFYGFDFASTISSVDLSLRSDLPGSSGQQTTGSTDMIYRIDLESDCALIAIVQPQGSATRLALLDSHHQVVDQSDGISATDPTDAIDEDLRAGVYFLEVSSTSAGGQRAYTLTTMLTLAPPLEGKNVGSSVVTAGGPEWGPSAMVEGDFSGDGQLDLAFASAGADCVSVLLGDGDGTFRPGGSYAVGSWPRRSWRVTSPGTGTSTSPSPTSTTTPSRCCWAMGMARFSRRCPTRWGRTRTRSCPETSPAAVELDLAVANTAMAPSRCCWATATAPSSRRSPTRWGCPRMRSWRATSPATVNSISPSPTTATAPSRCCWATATAPSSRRSAYGVGPHPDVLVAGDFTDDGRLDVAVASGSYATVSILLGDGDGTFQPQVTYAVGLIANALVSGDFTGDGSSTSPSPNYFGNKSRYCWATVMARSGPVANTR